MSYLSHTVIRIRLPLSILLAFALPEPLLARLTEPWTYNEMFNKADLVAIAYVVSSRDTNEHTTLAGDIEVVGVTTEFRSALILKGPHDITTFQLHHYRFKSETDRENIANAPALVRIGPHHPVFLLFLVHEPDGRYAPVTGQTDPALFSVIRLDGAALADYGGPPPPRRDSDRK